MSKSPQGRVRGVVYDIGSEKDTKTGLLYVTETGRCRGPPLAEIYRTRVALHAWPRGGPNREMEGCVAGVRQHTVGSVPWGWYMSLRL